jgi:hypothetical protein
MILAPDFDLVNGYYGLFAMLVSFGPSVVSGNHALFSWSMSLYVKTAVKFDGDLWISGFLGTSFPIGDFYNDRDFEITVPDFPLIESSTPDSIATISGTMDISALQIPRNAPVCLFVQSPMFSDAAIDPTNTARPLTLSISFN